MNNKQENRKWNDSNLLINKIFPCQPNSEASKIDSFNYLQEMFKDTLDHDVVYMIFAENDYNVEATLENLFILANESDTENKIYSKDVDCFSHSLNITEQPYSDQMGKTSFNNCTSFKKSYSSAVSTDSLSAPALTPKNKSDNFENNENNEEQDAIKNIRESKKALVFMRGLPGSGKSTLAKKIILGTNGVIHSTDDYFTSSDGSYFFDPSLLTTAHQWNLKKAYSSFLLGISPIVIDNTNLEIWEMKPYIFYSFDFDYKIFFMEPFTSWRYNINRLYRINRHGLTKQKLQRSLDRFEKIINADSLIQSLQKDHSLICKNNPKSNSLLSQSQIKDNEKKQIIISSGFENQVKFDDKFSQNDQHELNFRKKTNKQKQVSVVDNKKDKEANDNEDNSINKIASLKLLNLQTNSYDTDANEGQPFSVSLSEKISNVQNDLNMEPKPQRKSLKFFERSEINERSTKEDFNEPWESSNENNSKGAGSTQSNNLKRSKKLLVNMNVNQTNWQFPAFPIENCSNNSIENCSDLIRDFISIATQTEDRDWALLEIKQNSNDDNDTCNIIDLQSAIEISLISQKEYLKHSININTRKPKIDRGTSTETLPGDICYSDKLSKLKQDFPQAMEDHLREVLDACHGDYQWASNLLTLFSDEHFNANEINQNINEDYYFEQFDKADFQKDCPFVLKIDQTFAQQLEDTFGPVLGANKNINDIFSININKGVAKLIYDSWKKSYSQEKPIATSEKTKYDSNLINSKKSKSGSEKSNSSRLTLQPKSSFQEIMDLELACNLSRQEFYNSNYTLSTSHKDLLSTKLKRDQLKAIYPGLDEQALEEVFEANSFKLSDTIKTIDATFGISSNLSAELQEQLDDPELNSQQLAPIKSEQNLEQIRSQMVRWNEMKKEYMEKAKICYKSKKYAIASYYSGQARECQAGIDNLRQTLTQIVASNSKNKLDLHGFHSSEVIPILESYLAYKQEELERLKFKKIYLDIITGRGIHSQYGPKIKPLVISYLQQKKYRFELINDGSLRITIAQ